MSRRAATFTCLFALATACGTGSSDDARPGAGRGPGSDGRPDGAPARDRSGFVEGKDYVVLERVRILDEMGFDRPVEAMSVLVPRGWRTESGVRWRGVNECRGEMITWQMTATSPDGAIRFTVLPVRSFGSSQNPMTQQVLVAASRQGGCGVSAPFDARRYLDDLARNELGASAVSDVRVDEAHQALIDRMSEQGNAVARQYGTASRQSGSAVYGTLEWPDGSKGLANVGVSVSESPGTDYYGNASGFTTTTVFHQVYVRYPPERESEALRVFGTITTSHRMNPVWQRAKDRFLTQLGNAEHAGRMERIRLMGEQAAAYARSASEASDARMRDWERSQASSDASQHRFIQTIREVETWSDPNGGPVELGAGYDYGWSRPDGSIILTNNSLFDPAAELQQSWSRMSKVKE
jgi:hypothetical protein